ncbi:uncharacterized protein BO97DRAFT_381926 [Aspergillus homomorphus CBS 101889]|uniref:Uncharacterized protein n=1 Tax=Aspergillus homomorphus (strain CBS 101889) TaxID=1450537 RepID=A0A395IA65_ASPHC|nr:hypothetical protein BO97DRAFT_381926 [Aspergillus homomorphus CBS 101889]RAL16855.1 hypothetical protein BO97DRAFT_381926 [Aspergillus homomorphus CBS 101889]
MASTTLMTFLLCTNPQVKSVKLLGSWDNFSKPYAMERDRRVGPGQWRGCHTFVNIVCDGSPSNMMPARSGGLKMGGTYWYYYLLDDDMESYNEAEPITTHCPFLPGQPVNVLNVPVILPDAVPTLTHSRSPSAQSVVQQTMNPEDKYLNPRRPPKPRPKLPRLRTSPPLLEQPAPAWSFSTSPLGIITNRSASQPSSATPKVKVNEGLRGPVFKTARSVSPPRSRGLLAAFRQWNVSSPELGDSNHHEADLTRPSPDRGPLHSHPHIPAGRFDTTPHPNIIIERPPSSGYDQAYKQTPHTGHHLTPAAAGDRQSVPSSNHDRQAQNSMEQQSFAEQSTPRAKARGEKHINAVDRSLWESSALLATSIGFTTTDDSAMTPRPSAPREKRLPTLPNSPSSVMDEALREIDVREKAFDTEAMVSHFSDFTDTESMAGSSVCERSHFSEWSTDTELLSPESVTCPTPFNHDVPPLPDTHASAYADYLKTSVCGDMSDPDTPHLTVNSKSTATSVAGDSPLLDLPLPRLSISLSPSDLSLSDLCIDDEEGRVGSNPKRHAAFFGEVESVKGLGLLHSPDPTVMDFPDHLKDDLEVLHAEKRAVSDPVNNRLSRASLLGQSAAMREMMTELSYLKGMIESGASAEM